MNQQMSRVAVTLHVGTASDATAGTSPTTLGMVAPGGTGPCGHPGFPGDTIYVDLNSRARFLAKIRRNGECWEWTGYLRSGYGKFVAGSRRDGSRHQVSAHRFAYELFVGPIPDGLTIDHLCRNTKCVSPAHLEPVTQRENTLRGTSPAAERARRTQCPKGHSDYIVRNGTRECGTCHRYRSNEMRVERARRQRARERQGAAATLDAQSEAEVARTARAGRDRETPQQRDGEQPTRRAEQIRAFHATSASDPVGRDGVRGGASSRPALHGWLRGRLFGQPDLPRRWTWIVTFAGFHTLALWTITPRIWR